MIILALSERFNRPLEYFLIEKNMINLQALLDMLHLQGEIQQERLRDREIEIKNRLMN